MWSIQNLHKTLFYTITTNSSSFSSSFSSPSPPPPPPHPSPGIPVFEPLLQSQTASLTSTTQFTCNVVSNPTATVTWAFNGAPLTNSDKYTISSTSLIISNLQMSDDGYYRCQASNSFGTNQTIAKLTVTG